MTHVQLQNAQLRRVEGTQRLLGKLRQRLLGKLRQRLLGKLR